MILSIIKEKIQKTGKFNLLKALPVLISLLIVFISYEIFSYDDYSNIIADYTLLIFTVLIFNFGLNAASQLIGNNKKHLLNEFKIIITLYILFLFILNIFFPKDLFLNFINFNYINNSLIYGWPILVLPNIVSFYFLGEKKYTYYFLVPIINNSLILLGIILYFKFDNYDLIFIFPLLFSFSILVYLLSSINYKIINNKNIYVIISLWKKNILPVLSSFIGVKNMHYFIITFLGKDFFGVYKLIQTIFNFLNFILSTEIIILANDSIKLGEKVLNNMKKVNNLKKVILFSNFLFCILCYLIQTYIYEYFAFDFDLFICFSIINICNLLFLLDNNIMFAAQRNSLRVYSDVLIFIILINIFLIINNFYSSLSYINLMFFIAGIYILNFFVSTFFYYIKK